MKKPASRKKLQRAKQAGNRIKSRFLYVFLGYFTFVFIFYQISFPKIYSLNDYYEFLNSSIKIILLAVIIRTFILISGKYLETRFMPKMSINLAPFLISLKRNLGFEIVKSVIGYFYVLFLLIIVNTSFFNSKYVAIIGLTMMLGIGGIEFFFNRKRYYKDLMMSEQELKNEAKESSVNPEVRHRMRKLSNSLSMNQALSTASFIVVVKKI